MIMFEKGEMYLCLVCPYDNFTEGREYLAITDDQLIDKYGVHVQICDDGCRFIKAEKPSISVESAKMICEKKIIDAIAEFEKHTGFDVKDVEVYMLHDIEDISEGININTRFFNRKKVTIVISL